MQRILITGGAGFIGTHLCAALAEDSRYEMVLVDNFRRDSLAHVPSLREHERVSVVTADISSPDALIDVIKKGDTVVHLAAIAGVSSYYAEPVKTLTTNILGTYNVLTACAKTGIRSFVYVSTSEVYGSDALWVTEEDPCQIGPSSDRRWVYATSKLAGENFALRSAEENNFDCTVIRPFNIYGPRQIGEGAISNFSRAVAASKPLTVYGDGSPIRAWCYVSDFVRAMQRVIESPPTEARIFNIGNPREVETTLGLARRFIRLAEEKLEIVFKPGVSAEVRARVPSIEAARRILQWEPTVSLDEGLTTTLAWFKEDGISR